MFVENFSKFIRYYGRGFKLKLFCFFAMSLLSGLLELLGVALVYPFILLLLSPESVVNTKYYLELSKLLSINNYLHMAFALGLGVILLFILKNLLMIIILYFQNKFVNGWKYKISKKFMHYYLFSSYKDSLNSSYSEKIYNLQFLVNQALDNFIFRIINLSTNAVIILMLLGLLFAKFLFAAILTSIFISFSIMFQNKMFKEKLKAISSKLIDISQVNNQKMHQNIKNIKEIKILSVENNCYNDYSESLKIYNNVAFKKNFYVSTPPYIIETLVVISLFILASIISLQNIENNYWMIASYAVLAAAIFRIAPALNRVQSSINSINSSRDFVKTIIKRYEELNLGFVEEVPYFDITFENNIKLKNIYFSYKKNPVIKGLNLEINKGEFVGIIGLSGSGKSTLADIIMGLLPIDKGEFFVDDAKINQNEAKAMRKLIGYVPQEINVIDGTFKENVAFGLKDSEINDEKVIEVLQKAQLYDFVKSHADGINEKVIFDSMGLSQGQKQRLAIARALYRDSEIIILDEATSSLDVEVEHEITQMLTGLKGTKTIIAIAHRLSTLKNCGRLIYMKDGAIVDTGTFDELSGKYPDFEKLINYSKI